MWGARIQPAKRGHSCSAPRVVGKGEGPEPPKGSAGGAPLKRNGYPRLVAPIKSGEPKAPHTEATEAIHSDWISESTIRLPSTTRNPVAPNQSGKSYTIRRDRRNA